MNRTEDHPRVCGEKKKPIYATFHHLGSPPRVRGKAVTPRSRRRRFRITPACAGKSCFNSAIARFSWDHPRVCGEKSFSRLPAFFLSGSPPRVRGKEPSDGAGTESGGITPACAGKRLCLMEILSSLEDHPRVCGEKTKKSP